MSILCRMNENDQPLESAEHKFATNVAGRTLRYVIHASLERTQGDFLYELTRPYWGKCGQQSLGPLVYFELCLVDYLENITAV